MFAHKGVKRHMQEKHMGVNRRRVNNAAVKKVFIKQIKWKSVQEWINLFCFVQEKMDDDELVDESERQTNSKSIVSWSKNSNSYSFLDNLTENFWFSYKIG